MKNKNVLDDKNKKKKKNGKSVKVSLNSPFDIQRPLLDRHIYDDIRSTLVNLLTINVKQYLKEHKTDDLNTKKNKKIKFSYKPPFLDYIVIGFNAVMRGLEKNEISCVFVKADAKPNFLVDSFIPVCNINDIPLIFIFGLCDIVSKVSDINSCLALGFKKSVCEEDNMFNCLYKKCLGLIADGINSPFAVNCENKLIKPTSRKCENLDHIPTKEEIVNCQLKVKNPAERVFKPQKMASGCSNILEGDLSFISLGDNSPKISISIESDSSKSCPPKRENTEMKMESTSESFSFFIDHGDNLNENESMVCNTPDKIIGVQESKSSSKKRKLARYFPATIKRIKGNPNRK